MAETVSEIAAAHVEGIDLAYRAPELPGNIRSVLPRPILADDNGWLDLYWRAWSIAHDKLRSPNPQTGLVRFCDAAFSDNIFQWDTCFMLRFLRYAPETFCAFGSLDNFYLKQHDDGFICREIDSRNGEDFWRKNNNSSVNPPLFADAEWSLFSVTGDVGRVRKILPALHRYHGWLSANRGIAGDGGYWTTALASGMDNSPRAYDAGGADVHESYGYTWLCLTAQMALSALRISELAEAAGETRLRQQYADEYEVLRDFVRRTFWNASSGFYSDLQPDGIVSSVLTPATFWPLLLPGESDDRVTAIESALLDPGRLARTHMVPSLSADHPLFDTNGHYWQGSVWPPMVGLAVRAMDQSGRLETARRIAKNHLDMIRDTYASTGTFWENYSPDHAAPGQIARPEFVGWTGCGPISMLIEDIIGLRPSAPERRVYWQMSRNDRHGVENLLLGSQPISLVFEADSRTILSSAEKPFELIVNCENQSRRIAVDSGTHRHALR